MDITDIIAIDPGLVSGVAHVVVIPDGGGFEVADSDELGPDETGDWLQRRIDHFIRRDTTAFAIERFTITPKTATNSQAPWSLEVIGQTKWIMRENSLDWRVRLLMQSPSDAKSIFPNPRLKALGLWHRGGKGHAMDALRHCALVAHRAKLLTASGDSIEPLADTK